MTSVILILLCIVPSQIQGILKKQYSLKYEQGGLVFTAISVFFSFLFFVCISWGTEFDPVVVPYAVLFGLAYAATMVGNYIAIANGPYAITNLISSYSLVIPTLYGLIFLKEEAGLVRYAGIMLLLISLFLIRAKEDADHRVPFSRKWLIALLVAFVANGMAAVIQNAEIQTYGSKNNQALMLISLGIATLGIAVFAIIYERKYFGEFLKKGLLYGGVCGICNGAHQVFVMMAIAAMAASIFYPALSAIGLVTTFVVSRTLFKEKLVPRQIAGFLCGIFALVFLNL